MIKTPLSTVIGGAFWTPGATVINGKEIFSVFVKSLFANGEQGFWYDPNDMGTMFQDAAGTVPVTAAGQPVGLMKDKSGRNNHAYQSVSASRPILQRNATTGAYYLKFDGVDDRLTTNSFPAMGLATTLFAGSFSSNSNTGALVARSAGGYVYQLQSKTDIQGVGSTLSIPTSGNTVITAKYAASGTGASLKVNNVTKVDQNLTYRGYDSPNPLTIGAFNSSGVAAYSGHIYILLGVSKEVLDSESVAIEREIAKRLGVTLNV